MPTLIQRARRFRLFAPIQTRHRFLNCIGFTFSAADKLLRTDLRKRFDAARTGAVVESALHKKPLDLRLVWNEFQKSRTP